jgi:hypothetical protein
MRYLTILTSKYGTALALAALLAGTNGCTKKDFSADYDINWPVPVIASITPLRDTIGKTITINGEKFDKLSKVTIGSPETDARIISASATQIKVQIPRIVNAGPITVYTNYKQKKVSDQSFTPVFLDAKVTQWPTRITRGQAFSIKGENMDMVTEVMIDDVKVNIAPATGGNTTELSVGTQGITLADEVVVKITKARAGIANGVSNKIKVEAPSDIFVPEPAVILFDFETGSNPFVQAGGTPTTGFNTSGAPKGRGQRYLTVKQTGAANWTYLGDATNTGTFDLTKFHKPHITFLVNTQGKQGYFQFEVSQAGTKWGMHFTSAISPFDYVMTTSKWTWVSVPLEAANLSKWGGTGTTYDPKGILEYAKLGFSTGNGAGDWEINVDQVMITDGAQKPIFNGWDFEDGVNPYSGSATNGINQSGIATISGNNYLTVGLANAGNWNWTGDMYKSGPVDMAQVSNAHINFWVNTNGKKGFFQIETTQGGIKWGGNLDANDYMVQTNGWKLYSLRLADIQWSKWGGSGTATGLDPKGILDYLKIGFSTGNVAGPYEVNIDDVYISDGPMF